MKDRFTLLFRLFALRIALLLSLLAYVFHSYEIGAHSLGVLTLWVTAVGGVLATVLSWYVHRNDQIVSDKSLGLQLLVDAVLVLLVAYCFGRSTNPFLYYLLVVIALGAGLLKERWSWCLCVGGVIAYTILMYLDQSKHFLHLSSDFKSHLIGMWVNFVLSAVLLEFFISKLTATLRRRERALASAREEILKNEQLVGLGTLAAATVHSFGTPLSTITMLAGEIQAKHHDDDDTFSDAKTIQEQISRCRNTMQYLTDLARQEQSQQISIELDALFENIEDHYALMNCTPLPTFVNHSNVNSGIAIPGGILFMHAVINLIDNGVRAAKSLVKVEFECTASLLRIVIEDDGPGIASDLLEDLGEVVVDGQNGMGLGVLLSNSTIEKLGGRVKFSNPSGLNAYTRVSVEVPLDTVK